MKEAMASENLDEQKNSSNGSDIGVLELETIWPSEEPVLKARLLLEWQKKLPELTKVSLRA